jgi:hypothetical protein
MTVSWRYLPVALCVFSLACGGKTEAPSKGGPAAAGKPTAAAEATSPVAEVPKGTFIAKFRLGPAFGPDGTVSADMSIFKPGDPIFTSFEIPNAPAGSKVRVAWALLPDKKPVARQEAPLSPDKPAVSFKADSRGWPIGEYEFEISLAEAGKEDARLMGTAPFKIVREKLK